LCRKCHAGFIGIGQKNRSSSGAAVMTMASTLPGGAPARRLPRVLQAIRDKAAELSVLAAAVAVCGALWFQGGAEALISALVGAFIGRRSDPISGAFAGLFIGALLAGFFHGALAALWSALPIIP